MVTVTKLSLSLAAEAVAAEDIRYEIDKDGDIHFKISRMKGKYINIYILHSQAEDGVFSMTCMVARWFGQSDFAKLLLLCNEWSRSHNIPMVWVPEPDADDDYRVLMNQTIFCSNGIYREMIQENLRIFLRACEKFWDELDEQL